jgi:hypothetical protein
MEKVMLGRRQLDKIISEKIPVYDLKMDGDKPFVDPAGISFVGNVYGIDSGEVGFIDGTPLKVYKSTLKFVDKSEILAGSETTMIFPIYLDKYKKIVWVPTDMTHMV